MIATGEVLTRRQAFAPLITSRAVDIIQPDVTKCGGLSEALRLAWLAYDHGVLLVPHGWNTGVGVAADLALSAAMPVARWVEFQTGVPYIEEIVLPRFQLDDEGLLRVPTGPGLGIELNPDCARPLRTALATRTKLHIGVMSWAATPPIAADSIAWPLRRTPAGSARRSRSLCPTRRAARCGRSPSHPRALYRRRGRI